MSNVPLNIEDGFSNDTIHENLQADSSIDPDSIKIEWRLPLAVIFAIIIYLIIVIVIFSGSDVSSLDFF